MPIKIATSPPFDAGIYLSAGWPNSLLMKPIRLVVLAMMVVEAVACSPVVDVAAGGGMPEINDMVTIVARLSPFESVFYEGFVKHVSDDFICIDAIFRHYTGENMTWLNPRESVCLGNPSIAEIVIERRYNESSVKSSPAQAPS